MRSPPLYFRVETGVGRPDNLRVGRLELTFEVTDLYFDTVGGFNDGCTEDLSVVVAFGVFSEI